MALSQSQGAVCVGMAGQIVEVQVHLASGLPGMTIVGLPDTSISESRDRVRSAVVNSGFDWPGGRITVGLSPAFEHKRGSGLDLAVAIAVLAGLDVLTGEQVADAVFLAELGLDGSVRAIPGAVAMALGAARHPGALAVFASPATAGQIARVPGLQVVPVSTLRETVGILRGQLPLPDPPAVPEEIPGDTFPEMSEVIGQPLACRALEVAAAGGHHVLMSGPPGVGKTMLAQRLPGLLPLLDDEQVLQVAAIRDAMDGGGSNVSRVPPFCSPHHSASHVAMVGGATAGVTRPGQITMSHHGVLFLDEAPEFSRTTLECLRQPLEEGCVSIARAAVTERLPASFQLVLAANPCPCGETRQCRCSAVEIRRYRSRLSGPLLDRVDLRIRLEPPRGHRPGESSAVIRARVGRARDRARERLRPHGHQLNARTPPGLLHAELALQPQATRALERYAKQSGWSRRTIDRLIRVSWTLADLAGVERPGLDALEEAVLLRNKASEVVR